MSVFADAVGEKHRFTRLAAYKFVACYCGYDDEND